MRSAANAEETKRPGHFCPGHPSIFRPPIGTGGFGAEGSQMQSDYTRRTEYVNEKALKERDTMKKESQKRESSV